jgi:transcriptional regulator with XRE-family HTH domain
VTFGGVGEALPWHSAAAPRVWTGDCSLYASMKNRPKTGLAELRRKRGVSIEQIAKRTKITSRYLEAIESGRIHELPGGVYRRDYIRQYAAAINCDVELVSGLCSYEVPADPEPHVERGGLLRAAWRLLGFR